MILRELQLSDANEMVKWMHDSSVVSVLPTRFEDMTVEDCKNFILSSKDDEKNMHKAICDGDGNYIGTVSLKDIDYNNATGELAIVLTAKAIGKGYACNALKKILSIAFCELGLNRVYLCVFEDNIRAIKFYEKMNLKYEGTFREHRLSKDGLRHNLCWYSILRTEFECGK
ncbi:MAG: GNAT family protein [Lachnospiraceae bacterium]